MPSPDAMARIRANSRKRRKTPIDSNLLRPFIPPKPNKAPQDVTPAATARRTADRHDGLCVQPTPYNPEPATTFCWCRCVHCWDNQGARCICAHCGCRADTKNALANWRDSLAKIFARAANSKVGY